MSGVPEVPRFRQGRARGRRHLAIADLAPALLAAAVAGAAAWLLAAPVHARQSTAPHFVLLADAMLHGHLWIDPARGGGLGDITPFGGKLYVAFPPLPALLMLPFVAAAGPGFNDSRFTLLLGAANAALTYLLVRRLSRPGFAGPGVPLGPWAGPAVTALFALGTVHLYSSAMGRVWFTAHVVAVAGLLLYLLECAGQGRPLVAGAALAAAALSRPPAAFGALCWLLLAARGAMARRPRPGSQPRLAATLNTVAPAAAFALPLALAGGLLLAQNAIRFGSPLDFGYLTMRVAPPLAPDLRRYGQFNPHFLARNVSALLLTPPQVDVAGVGRWLRAAAGPDDLARRLNVPGTWRTLVQFDPWGTGLWAVSPALLVAVRRPRRQDVPLAAAAGLATLAIAVPNLLYYNTGWAQYGYRFALDFLPFLLVLVTLGLRRPLHPLRAALFAVLLVVSVASNVAGARWFWRLPPF